MKYRVGDRVRIKSIDWYNENKGILGNIECGDALMTFEKARFCGKIVTISSISNVTDTYRIEEDNGLWNWTDEMIEGLVEESDDFEKMCMESEKRYEEEYSTGEYCHEQSFKWGFQEGYNYSHENDKLEISLKDGYQFVDENGNVINAQKIVLEKKKKSMIREEQIDNAAQEYIDSDNAVLTYSDGFCEQTDHPFVRAAFKAGVEWADDNVTQDDCSKAPKLISQDYTNGRFGYQIPAGFEAKLTERELILTPEKPKYPKSLLDCENVLNGVRNDRKKLLHKFNELLICRDAYWKIAGDEMGLGKPWEPDWDTNENELFVIANYNGTIVKTGWYYIYTKILVFPTLEMRDAFYENFKKEIEECKELL